MRKWRRRDGLAAVIAALAAASAINAIALANRAIAVADVSGGRKGLGGLDGRRSRRGAGERVSRRGSEYADQRRGGKRKRSMKTERSRGGQRPSSDGGPLLLPNATLRLPNVLLVGAQKGGSSAVAQWLFSRPGACRPRAFPGEPLWNTKEAHFFDEDDRYERGIGFYAKRFEHCRRDEDEGSGEAGTAVGKRLVIDATPNYLPHADRVRRTYDEVGVGLADGLRIIMILREPVARELSLYNHKKSLAWWDKNRKRFSFWQNMVQPDDGTLSNFWQYASRTTLHAINDKGRCKNIRRFWWCYGLYAKWLRRWISLFSQGQILVLSHDELVRDEPKLRWRLQMFLGMNESSAGSPIEEVNVRHRKGKLSLPPCHVHDKLARAFWKGNERLYKVLKGKTEPAMEQRPFPRFVLSNCTLKDGQIKSPTLNVA